LQNFLDVDFAHLVKRERLPIFVARKPRSAMIQLLRKIAQIDEVSSYREASGGNHIFQFAHVAGPWM